MLKIPNADAADVEAVLRTLQLLASHENFAQALTYPTLLATILALIAPPDVSSSYPLLLISYDFTLIPNKDTYLCCLQRS